MNFRNIILESEYEMKCTRRNVLSNIFILFTLLTTFFSIRVLSTGKNYTKLLCKVNY